MTWQKHYQPAKMAVWKGRKDAPKNAYLFQNIQALDLTKPVKKQSEAFALLGFCSDVGVKRNLGRIGAKKGPAIIRQCLSSLALHREKVSLFDAGDILVKGTDLESAQAALADAVSRLLNANITPILLGGGHEIAWGHFQGIAKYLKYEKSLGIVNFDAHLDMRPLLSKKLGSSGTPFLQIANAHEKAKKTFHYACLGLQPASNIKPLMETAQQHNVQTVMADAFSHGDAKDIERALTHIYKNTDQIYLTLCLDVFATPFAPGVSAPQALGLSTRQVLPVFKLLSRSGKVISYDVAELCPTYDIDNRTAKLAAQFINEVIHTHTFKGDQDGKK